MKNQVTLTEGEKVVLTFIRNEQNERGHSDFTSDMVGTKSIAGVVSSLEKKGMIYDAYADFSKEDFQGMTISGKRFKMWCMTEEAAEQVGTPKYWN